MPYILEISFLSLLVFLFCIFRFAKDDFTLLRKNITLEQLFNISFILYILGFLSARLVFVLEHLNSRFLDPFVLFLFPYFPGLSVSGGILAGIGFLFGAMNSKRLPFFRVFDIFTISFLYAWTAGLPFFAIAEFFVIKKISLVSLFGTVGFFLLTVLVHILFVRNKFKDGSIGYLGISLYSVSLILFQAFLRGRQQLFHFVPEDVVLAFITFFFFAMFIYAEILPLFTKGRK